MKPQHDFDSSTHSPRLDNSDSRLHLSGSGNYYSVASSSDSNADPFNSSFSFDSVSKSARLAPLVLIPAAGFGTRVGSPAAKELFLNASGSPLIAFGLDQARLRGWPVHVITRKEKTELIRYLEDYRQMWSVDVEIQLIEPSREWPDTLLKSQPFWREKNLLCLPDTVFEPLEVWDQLANSTADLAAATFQPPDLAAAVFDPKKKQPSIPTVKDPSISNHRSFLSTWGVFRIPSATDNLAVCEKPQEQTLSANFYKAWGALCWQQAVGQLLLQAQLESSQDHQWKDLNMSFEAFSLHSFQDVTRGY